MNEKLRNHVNILFAAAPKNAKAEEIKEELLTNLNDKYNDLLANGYDSESAFHVALSGIGDIDELFKECGGTMFCEEVPPSTAPDMKAILNKTPTSTLVLAVVCLFLVTIIIGNFPTGIGFRSNFGGSGTDSLFVLNLFGLLCLTGVVALTIYVLYVLATRSNGNVDIPFDAQVRADFAQSQYAVVQKSDITLKRIVAGVLAILLGCFGVHKFYLGFIGTGLIMLLITVLSLFILTPVTAIIGFIEGVLYIAKSDRDFYRDYEIRRRNWF